MKRPRLQARPSFYLVPQNTFFYAKECLSKPRLGLLLPNQEKRTFLMIKAPSAGRARPRILYSQTPHSISRRAKSLPRTAGELLRHLCELTIGFGKGSVDLPYRALAEALGRDWSTVARAAMLLKKSGDVVTEPLRDGSYRWSVVLEPGDVVSDPLGLYRVRTVSDAAASPPPHGVFAIPPMAKTPWGHGENAIPPMAKTPWGRGVVDNVSSPYTEPSGDGFEEDEKEALKIDLKDTYSKIHQQKPEETAEAVRDDEPFDHKKLLQELRAIGVGQRVARKLLRQHEHAKVAQALEHTRQRKDVSNPAGYVVREVEDGGYKDHHGQESYRSTGAQRTALAVPAASHIASDRARSEAEQLERERQEKEAIYREGLKKLLARFSDLSAEVKLELKGRWTEHKERLVPNTSRKAELLKEPRFERLAFREVTTRFFDLIDEGLEPGEALEQLAAA